MAFPGTKVLFARAPGRAKIPARDVDGQKSAFSKAFSAGRMSLVTNTPSAGFVAKQSGGACRKSLCDNRLWVILRLEFDVKKFPISSAKTCVDLPRSDDALKPLKTNIFNHVRPTSSKP